MLGRLTPRLYFDPWHFVEDDERWATIDLEDWSRRTYTWEQDPLTGLLDLTQHPETTYEDGTGDCEDYAVLAASVLVSRGTEPVSIGFVYRLRSWYAHVVAFTDGRVYSSGEIIDTDFETYASQFDLAITTDLVGRKS